MKCQIRWMWNVMNWNKMWYEKKWYGEINLNVWWDEMKCEIYKM